MSKPLPPSTETGALMLYETWSEPSPPRICVCSAVEKPPVVFGIATPLASVHDRARRRVRLGEREAADDEGVVAVVALEPELGLVRVHGEGVVAVAAHRDERGARALAEVAARGRDGRERVVRAVDVEGGALQAVDLADLERVVALAAVERRRGAVVVDREEVVAAEAVDLEPPVVRGRVVDPLDAERAGADDPGARVLRARRAGHVGVEDADERRPQRCALVRAVGAGARDRRDAPQQEDVVDRVVVLGRRVDAVVGRILVVVAVDREDVRAVAGCAGVEDVDHVVAVGAAAAGREDLVDVAAGLAVERERLVARDGHRVEPVDDQVVLAVGGRRRRAGRGDAAVDAHAARQRRLLEGDRVRVEVAEDARVVERRARRVELVGADRALEEHDRAERRLAAAGLVERRRRRRRRSSRRGRRSPSRRAGTCPRPWSRCRRPAGGRSRARPGRGRAAPSRRRSRRRARSRRAAGSGPRPAPCSRGR